MGVLPETIGWRATLAEAASKTGFGAQWEGQ